MTPRSPLASGLVAVPVLSLALLACSGGGDPAGADGGAAPDAAADLGPCPADTLCLEVTEVDPGKPIASGRLVVVWRQLLDVNGLDEVPKIAYEAPFEPGAPRYDIPLAGFTLPDDNQLLCQWDSQGCHRDSVPRAVGFGMVMVVEDDDGSGFLENAELSPFSASGAAFAYVAWSDGPRPVGSRDLQYESGDLTHVGEIFPDGILGGVAAYDTVPVDGGFDFALRPLAAGATAELAMCPSTSQCSVTIPRLVGMTYP